MWFVSTVIVKGENMSSTSAIKVKRENEFTYDILFRDNFDDLADAVKNLSFGGQKACIVTDSNVEPLYLEPVRSQLEIVCSKVSVFTFHAGERQKNLDTVNDVYEHLIQEKFDRKDFLVALGGGVSGDLTGFAAATYLRGISFIQIPTTLLAQVDSSIGGKTGVDFRQYKNMIGAFHQPVLVYMNLNTLKTLPDVEFSCGMGEVLKSGLIKDESFYDWTINNMYEIQERDTETLKKMISRCCEIKKFVVEKDPKEQSERALLNFGHTVGHAIEKLMNFELHHGQCVGLGMVAAAYISFKRGLLSMEELYEIRDMNVGFDLPITFSGLDPEQILEATKLDKKMDQGRIRFILLKSIGKAYIDHTVTDAEILAAIDFINGDRIDHE